ncbi:MAG: cache domain-containing protein [Phycisphaerae bacterium]
MRLILLALVMFFVLSWVPSARAGKGPRQWTFIRMDYARNEKLQQLRRFCDHIHDRAASLRHDEILIEFFDVNRKYDDILRNGPPPDKLTRTVQDFRKQLADYYINNYLCFYDLLFVDKSGFVVYTIRKEPDYHTNLLQDDSSYKPLADALRRRPEEETFIDFRYYAPSQKPAAFFVEPVHHKEEHIGWIIAQCAINKVNSLFAGAEQLGATGEAFLVNRQGYMLTESTFQGESSILKKRLDDKNIDAKFREKKGHKTVTDYRGVTAITSFEVFDFLGTQWLVVVKVDETQIVTEHFKQHRRYYMDVITDALASLPVAGSEAAGGDLGGELIRVDMDEFRRADHGESLQTVGVSTCTAVIASCPGKFGYMAHISPFDKLYGGDATNLLGHIIKKIKTYDIYKYERYGVHFAIVANHFDSLGGVVNKLVDEGFQLSQINVLYHPDAKSANVRYEYSIDRTSVEWVLAETRVGRIGQDGSDAHNLGAIVKEHLDD